MKKMLTLFLMLPLLVFAQEKGIHFQHNLSWSAIKAKAKAEKKFIFVDCFTTWCGPCRYMSANVFPQQQVGDLFNSKFINLKLQLDTTANDNDEVKKMYADAHNVAATYKVRVYPTYLFFSPEGKLVHRAVGSSEADAFVTKAKDALNPQKQYYTLLEKYQTGSKDSAFLHALALASLEAYDTANAPLIAKAYLKTQPDLYTQDNLSLLQQFTGSSKDTGFSIMLNNADKVDAVLGKGTAEQTVQRIILNEEVFPKIFNQQVQSPQELQEPDWSKLTQSLQEKYPVQADEAIAFAKIFFYRNKEDWNNFGPAVVAYMQSYGDNTPVNQLNDFAWTVFQNCPDMKCVEQALEWSRRSFEGNNTPAFMDTYANILYRLGRTDEAIQWEQKAVSLVEDANDKKNYLDVIEKMKKGEKTWN